MVADLKRTVASTLLFISVTASFVIIAEPVLGDLPFLWVDDFNDGNYNYWTVYSGTWSVANGKLDGRGYFSPIRGHRLLSPMYTNTAFSSDRTVQSELRTETAGGVPYDVAVLMVKWV